MDEIKDRLKETSDNCCKSYEAWSKDQKNGDARATLQEAIHEMRKVSSRLEIEIAISERNEMTQKPIPIPPHRSSQPRQGDDNDNAGNRAGAHEGKAVGTTGTGGGGKGGPRRRGGGGPRKSAGGQK